MTDPQTAGSPIAREVIVGRHSKVWVAAIQNAAIAARFKTAIGHSEIAAFRFEPNDRVWIFSYSRRAHENSRLFDALAKARVAEVVYVSSASTVVTEFTRCYEYPSVKRQAEMEAVQRLGAKVLQLGLVYKVLDELPAGENAATHQSDLESFMLAPEWSVGNQPVRLFGPVTRPFPSGLEAALYRVYGSIQWSIRRWPCLLRPVDLVLRTLGFRWYGYIHLSNRLWISRTS